MNRHIGVADKKISISCTRGLCKAGESKDVIFWLLTLDLLFALKPNILLICGQRQQTDRLSTLFLHMLAGVIISWHCC